MTETNKLVKEERSVILIEDHGAYRDSVAKLLSEEPGLSCADSFSNMEDALEAIAGGLSADIILLDLGLPGMDGISGIAPLREKLPTAQIIVLSAFTDKEKVFAALEAGAHGYLVKSASATKLINSLNGFAENGTLLDPQIAGMVLRRFQKLKPIESETNLSTREREILTLIAKGVTKKAIASELEITESTVSTYLRRAFDKLHVHSLPSAVSEAIRRGLIDFSEQGF